MRSATSFLRNLTMACFFRRTRSSRVRVHLIACLLHQTAVKKISNWKERKHKHGIESEQLRFESRMQQLEQVTQSQNDRFPTQQSWKTSHRISSKAGTHVKQQRHESRSRRAPKMGKSRRVRNSAKKLRNPGS
jgi:hypothetical protein